MLATPIRCLRARSTGKPGNGAFYLSCSLNFSLLLVFRSLLAILISMSFNDSITIFFAAFYDSEMLRLEYVRKKKLRFDFGTAANDDMQWLGKWKGLLGLNHGNGEDFLKFGLLLQK